MTLPSEREASTPTGSRAGGPVTVQKARPAPWARLRGLLFAGSITLGLLVAVVVAAVPELATPIGTGAGVVAVVMPIVQWLSRDGRSRDGGGGL